MCTQDGLYVLGYQQPTTPTSTEVAIQIPTNATGLAIDKSGGVSYIDPTTNTRVTPYRLTLATFPNAAGLERQGGNLWIKSANSGLPNVNQAGEGGAGSLTAGAVEMSNVDLAQTFTNMITAQRGFQANSRVISTADSMLEELVNLKR
jgi:flagellar hook protein FlgE